jgi:type-F conjugative transfer system pilin assembly protein TrbC
MEETGMLPSLRTGLLILVAGSGSFLEAAAEDNEAEKSPAYAEGKAFAEEMQRKNTEEMFAEVEKLKMQLQKIPPAEGRGCRGCKSELSQPAPRDFDSDNGILVFVSFSVPAPALKILSGQAKKHGAKLILRGAVDGSFRKTAEFMEKIAVDGDMFVHPELFRKHGIKRVPTFVKMKDGKEVDRLSGNVDLVFAGLKLGERRQ